MPVEWRDATHLRESHGFCRMGKCASRNRAFRKLYLFGTDPPGRLGRSGSTRADVVLETSCADNVAKYSGRPEVSSRFITERPRRSCTVKKTVNVDVRRVDGLGLRNNCQTSSS